MTPTGLTPDSTAARARRILLVEDDERIATLVARSLAEAGYQVDLARDGIEGEAKAKMRLADLILLDVMLPGQDGKSLCRRLREQDVHTPVLMLTARDSVGDRVQGLDAGADDYLVKPFALDELLARIRVLLRRRRSVTEAFECLQVGDLVINVDTREGQRAGRPIDLTDQEFRLLTYLMRNVERVLTRNQLLEAVWGYDASNATNTVETYIHYLREKVDRGHPRPLIRTIRGVGYMIKP